jgi:hypothetical protein
MDSKRPVQWVPLPPRATPYCCPVCNGAGISSRPPYVPGDQRTWANTAITFYPCRACNETGIVWG